jgi:hypothetical protein
MQIHETVRVRVGDMDAEIDKDIAPLIREIWEAGIVSCNSCQENEPGIVWIEFMTPTDAERFVNIVAEYEDGIDTLYNRITGERSAKEKEVKYWEYDPFVFDYAMKREFENGRIVAERHDGVPDIVFSLSIRFPRSERSSCRLRANGAPQPSLTKG